MTTSTKVGARNSQADLGRLKQILALVTELISSEQNDAGKGAALKLMASPGMDPESAEAYARQEMYDIQIAASALGALANLTSEADEPDDIVKVANIMRGLLNFISGEVDEMEAAGKLGDADGEVGEPSNTSAMLRAKKAPITIQSDKSVNFGGMNLSYVKSMGFIGSDDDLTKRLAVKFVGRDEIKSYTNMWGSPTLTDIELEYFKPDTDFWDKQLGKSARPLTWDHAQDPDFKGASPVIGQMVDFGDDEVGRWYVAKLDRSHRYRKAIDQLIKDGKLGTSSDSAPQYVERVKTGKSTWLKTWPLFAAALTDCPCEPRMIGSIDYLKSLGITLPETPNEAAWKWNHAKLELLKSKRY